MLTTVCNCEKLEATQISIRRRMYIIVVYAQMICSIAVKLNSPKLHILPISWNNAIHWFQNTLLIQLSLIPYILGSMFLCCHIACLQNYFAFPFQMLYLLCWWQPSAPRWIEVMRVGTCPILGFKENASNVSPFNVMLIVEQYFRYISLKNRELIFKIQAGRSSKN